MKMLKSFVMVVFMFLGWSSQVTANHDIEGLWKNARTNVSLEVRKTYDGISVKRLDRSGWIDYRSFRNDQFRDSRGNTYVLQDNGILEWESYEGRKRLQFKKDHSDSHYQSQTGSGHHGDKYVERNYHYGKGRNDRSLEGRWINKSSGQAIMIKERRRSIKVKAHRGGWTTFDQRRGHVFVDHYGNRYEFRNGRLSYTSQSGDFMMRFMRYR